MRAYVHTVQKHFASLGEDVDAKSPAVVQDKRVCLYLAWLRTRKELASMVHLPHKFVVDIVYTQILMHVM